MGFLGLFKKKKKEETKIPETKAPQKAVATEVKADEKAPKATSNDTMKTPVARAAQSLAKKESASLAASNTEKKPDSKKPSEKEAEAKKPEVKKSETKKAVSFAGKFEIKKSRDGKYVFNLYAANSVIVATSQIYSSSAAAQNGIRSVIDNAERANVEDQTLKSYETQNYPKWEIYLDKGNQFRFRLCAPNGSCICHSQGYTTKSSCKNGIESIIRTAKNAAVDKSYLKKD